MCIARPQLTHNTPSTVYSASIVAKNTNLLARLIATRLKFPAQRKLTVWNKSRWSHIRRLNCCHHWVSGWSACIASILVATATMDSISCSTKPTRSPSRLTYCDHNCRFNRRINSMIIHWGVLTAPRRVFIPPTFWSDICGCLYFQTASKQNKSNNSSNKIRGEGYIVECGCPHRNGHELLDCHM